MPDLRTIRYWMKGSDESEWYAQSKTMAQHNKAGSHERRFAILMNDNFRLTSDLETWVSDYFYDFFGVGSLCFLLAFRHVYLTQIMQSEALSFAYRSWRRGWRGKGKEFVRSLEHVVKTARISDCRRRRGLSSGSLMTVGLRHHGP